MTFQLRVKDILLRNLDAKFFIDFDQYLRVHDNNKHNTAVKYCLNLKRIINVAILEGVMPFNRFVRHKTVYKDTQQVYLYEYEVSLLEQITLQKAHHILVRDLFLFQCYTGLAYTDLSSLTSSELSRTPDGNFWILKRRQKSGILSTIPLLPQALEILKSYAIKEKVQGQPIFPTYSIQKYNKYIREIGIMTGIDKKLSSHVGRRTFGNVALSKGLPLNVISKILGHSNTLITQKIYAITTQSIISQEIRKWH